LRIFGKLVGDGGKLSGDGYYARNPGTADREGGAFTGRDGMEGVRGEVLDKVGVESEAIPGLRKYCCQEGEQGGPGSQGGW